MPRTRKVVFAAAIVLAVFLILLIWLWPRGRHEGPAVVEITIKATDTLTLGINVDRGKTLRAFCWAKPSLPLSSRARATGPSP